MARRLEVAQNIYLSISRMTKRYISKSELLSYLYRQKIDIKMSASRYFDDQATALCNRTGIWLAGVRFHMALARPNCSDDMEEDRQIKFDAL